MLFKFAIPLVVVLLSLFGGAVWLLDVNPLPQFAERGEKQKEAAEEPAPKPAQEHSSNDLEALKEALAPADAKSAGDAPQFDIARIDPAGASVFAGTAEPNSRVTITADGAEVGTADVDENGEWALTIDKPISNPDAKLALFKASQSGLTDRTDRIGEAAEAARADVGPTTDGKGDTARADAAAVPAGNAAAKARELPLSPPNIAGGGHPQAEAPAERAAANEGAGLGDAADAATAAGEPAAPSAGRAAAVKADQMRNLEGLVAEARAAAEAEANANAGGNSGADAGIEAEAEAKSEAQHAHANPSPSPSADAPAERSLAAETSKPATNGPAHSHEPAREDAADTPQHAHAEPGNGDAGGGAAGAAKADASARDDADAKTADAGAGAAVAADAPGVAANTPSPAAVAPTSAPAKSAAGNEATTVASAPAEPTAIAAEAPASVSPEAPPSTTLASELPQAASVGEVPTVVAAATSESPQDTSAREAVADTAKTSLSVPVPVTFVYNQATLTAEGRRAAGLLLEYLQIKGFPQVTLTGHADERGSHELNMRLSQDRLEAVATFLREGGYTGPLKLVPKGKTEPYLGVVRGDFSKDDLWQLDRRVELVISQ